MVGKVWLALALLAAGLQSSDGQLMEIFRSVSNFFGGGEAGKGEVDGYENAPYTVTNSYQGFEERFYPEAKWACTSSEGNGSNGMFMRLFNYISGSNTGGSKIAMTVPVMTHVQAQGPKVSSNMCFFVPKQFQDSPPSPTDSSVRIETVAPMTVLVKSMGGYPDFEAEAKKFKEELVNAGQEGVDFSSYYSMGYDNPMKFYNRRNEVMFRKL